jgi:hypothetical protein
MPEQFISQFYYIFRWFSLAGPVYVLYMLPEWGLSLVNIFGVLAGIITAVMITISINRFKGKFSILKAIAIFFYFPYTLILNLILAFSILKYAFSKKKYFID